MNTTRHTRRASFVALFVTSLVALLPLAARAQEKQTSTDDWVPVKHLEFTDEDIQGGLSAPDGTLIESVPKATHSSLIEIRGGFEPELVKMTEDL